jgi:hypothetical protein
VLSGGSQWGAWEAFPTASGTKQGSELSPLLFGLFIELLHYLIKLKLPGAGPALSGLNVPDVMYADDVGMSAQPTVSVAKLSQPCMQD